MKEIQLTQGRVAQVDDEDYERVNQFKWHANRGRRNCYAARKLIINGKRTSQRMHVFIMGDNPLKLAIDHIDRDGLNNQSANLRFCTDSENQRNRASNRNSSSIYKGVCWDKRYKKWMVQIQINKKKIYLGYFDNEEDAAKAHDSAVMKYFGEFKRLNFPAINIL